MFMDKIIFTLGAILALFVLVWLLSNIDRPDRQAVGDEVMSTESDRTTPSLRDEDEPLVSVLHDTSWYWVETVYENDEVVRPQQLNIFQMNFSSTPGQVAVQTDCNNLLGTYTADEEGGISFSALSSTLMYCEGSQESLFAEMLEQASAYTLDNGQLVLSLGTENRVAVFEKVAAE